MLVRSVVIWLETSGLAVSSQTLNKFMIFGLLFGKFSSLPLVTMHD